MGVLCLPLGRERDIDRADRPFFFLRLKDRPRSRIGTPKTIANNEMPFNAVRLELNFAPYIQGAVGVVVSHPLSMREALGSIPRLSMHVCPSSGNLSVVVSLGLCLSPNSVDVFEKP